MFGLSHVLGRICGRSHGGVTESELQDLIYHNKFSDYLPWLAYDPDEKLYFNADDTNGFIWECTPLVFSAEKTLQIAEALLRLPLPPMSVMQFLLHADSNIKPILEEFRALRPGDDPLINDAVESYTRFLGQSTKGLKQTSGIPLRNIRLIVSLKYAADSDVAAQDVMSLIFETLNGMHLSPRHMPPSSFLEWLRRLFNDAVPEMKGANGAELAALYNDEVPIGKQVILGDTPIKVEFNHLQIGGKYWRCLTPKVYPPEVDPLQTKELFGGIWGLRSDNEQHRVPFLYSLNIIFDDLKQHLRNKCDLILLQSAAGSFARELRRKQIEHSEVIDKIAQGHVYARVMPAMWFIGDSHAQADDALKRGKTMWEGAGYVMQEDKGILTAMLLSSLPMGLRASKHNLTMLERDTIAGADSICNILPIQGDFSGSREPVMILQGRSGQICPISIFSRLANNFNGFIAGTSGGGKSFWLNMLLFNHYTAGTIIRIVDIGGSYKRLCHILGGRYLDFTTESDICLNPFSNVVDEEEDLPAIANIVMQMVYSSSEAPQVPEEEYTLAADAVRWAYREMGPDASVDNVCHYLRDYPKHADSGKRPTEEIVKRAHTMAFNMHEFTSDGQYGRYFVGRATFDIAKDRFVLLEMEALKNKPALFKVVTLLVLDAVIRDLYLSDRSQRRLVTFDESWQFLSGSSGNVMMRNMIESGFRRSRKYGGGFFVCSQSLLDRRLFGPIGDVIWGNADYKILLESGDFEQAMTEKLISYDQFTVEILKSVKRNSTKYSEVYMDTPYGAGVVRLAVDSFSYYLFTSDAKEMAEMESMVASGMTYREAIHEMVSKYRSS